MQQSIIIITSCTQRKRGQGTFITLAAHEMLGELPIVTNRWAQHISAAKTLYKVQNLYMGRSFLMAKQTAAKVGANLYVISAGFGLVSAEEPVPAYDLTISPGSASLGPLLARLGKTRADWWEAIQQEFGSSRSIRVLFEHAADALILLAVPAGYLDLIVSDLTQLTPSQRQRLRIFTSELGATGIPEELRPMILPYDNRLEGSSYKGTQTDFPQRALRHFIEALQGHLMPIDEAKFAVLKAMSQLTKPILPVRLRKSDEEIIRLLQENWVRFNGVSSRLLRFLRDEALIACEQSRFQSLRKQAQISHMQTSAK